jgi:hypothetical protein
MAINKNHEFEELNGIKCAIVEKNAKPERVAFLKPLLEFNGYAVVVQASAPAKAPAPPPTAAVPTADGMAPEPAAPLPTAPETYTVGVTDVSFNPINAIFGRLLKTPSGKTVTLAYWKQEQKESNDEIPYYEKP